MKAESNVGGLLGKSSRLLSYQFNTALKTYDLTVEQWSLLAVLWDKDVQKQKEMQKLTIPVAKENIAIAIQGVDPQELKIMMKVLTQIIDNLTKEKS